jgi:hypothetical protein
VADAVVFEGVAAGEVGSDGGAGAEADLDALAAADGVWDVEAVGDTGSEPELAGAADDEDALGDGDPGVPVADGVTDGEGDGFDGEADGDVGVALGLVGGLELEALGFGVGLVVGVPPPLDGGGSVRSGVRVGPSTEP